MKILIDLDIVSLCDENELIAYVSLQTLLRKHTDLEYITTKRLCFEGRYQKDQYLLERLRYGLKGLEEKNLIYIEDKNDYNSKLEYIVNTSILKKPSTHFIYLESDELFKIMNNPLLQKKQAMDLLRYFIYILSSFFHGTQIMDIPLGNAIHKIGNQSIQYLSSQSKVSEKTAERYNTLLEDMNLLYIRRSNHYLLNKSGSQYRMNNFYSRKKDSILCIQFAERYEQTLEERGLLISSNKKESIQKYRQSLLMKYNHILKGKIYSYQEVEEIRSFLQEENHRIKLQINQLIEKTNLTSFEEKQLKQLRSQLKDLSILDTAYFEDEWGRYKEL